MSSAFSFVLEVAVMRYLVLATLAVIAAVLTSASANPNQAFAESSLKVRITTGTVEFLILDGGDLDTAGDDGVIEFDSADKGGKPFDIQGSSVTTVKGTVNREGSGALAQLLGSGNLINLTNFRATRSASHVGEGKMTVTFEDSFDTPPRVAAAADLIDGAILAQVIVPGEPKKRKMILSGDEVSFQGYLNGNGIGDVFEEKHAEEKATGPDFQKGPPPVPLKDTDSVFLFEVRPHNLKGVLEITLGTSTLEVQDGSSKFVEHEADTVLFLPLSAEVGIAGEPLLSPDVGGTVSQLVDGETPAEDSNSSSSAQEYALPVAVVALAGVGVALAAGGWYVRRRWMR